MFDHIRLRREIFAALAQDDEKIADQVAAVGCRVCDGPLYRSDYARKPRGALMATAGEEFVTRFVALRARLIGMTVEELPRSIAEKLAGTPEERVLSLLRWLRPLTTGTGIGSRMLRDIA